MVWTTLGTIAINSNDPIVSSFLLGNGNIFRFIHNKVTTDFIPGYLSARVSYVSHGLFDYFRVYPNFDYPQILNILVSPTLVQLGTVDRKLILSTVGTYSVVNAGWTLRIDRFDV